jgi:hypothetical protein
MAAIDPPTLTLRYGYWAILQYEITWGPGASGETGLIYPLNTL